MRMSWKLGRVAGIDVFLHWSWLVVAILERTGLSRHIWHLPLFFLALAVLLSSIIGFVCFP